LKAGYSTFRKKSLDEGLSDADEASLSLLEKQAEPLRRKLESQRNSEIETIKGIIKDYEADADIYIGGIHALAYELIRIIKHDLIVFGIGIAAIMCLVLFLIFRKIQWVLLPILCCACSVVITMGSSRYWD